MPKLSKKSKNIFKKKNIKKKYNRKKTKKNILKEGSSNKKTMVSEKRDKLERQLIFDLLYKAPRPEEQGNMERTNIGMSFGTKQLANLVQFYKNKLNENEDDDLYS